MEQIQPLPEVVCDFCNLGLVTKVYDAAPIFFSFGFQATAIQSCDTKWAACAACTTLIDQDRWDELTERAVRFWHDDAQRRGVRVGARELAGVKVEMARLHRNFRDARRVTA
jgi:hypothetical protein